MNFDTKLRWLSMPVLILVVGIVGIVGIAGACSLLGSGTAPDDMSVEGHRRESQDHAAEAQKHRSRYDPDGQAEPEPGRSGGWGRWRGDYEYRDSGDYYWGSNRYNPSERHLKLANEHETLALKHREAARALEQFEEAECGSFPPETRVSCPLLGQLVSVQDIPSGSRIRLADGIDVNAAVAHMRCHIAFARSRGHTGMDSCPLYLEGVRVSRAGSGSNIDFLIEGSNELKTLRKRMQRHVVPDGQPSSPMGSD